MHVALLVNTAWLDEELANLRRLVVGLFDEQVRVTLVLPNDVALGWDDATFADRINWMDSRWSWLRKRRLASLRQRLEDAGVTLLHALDGRMWSGTLRLAEELELPAVLSANSAMDVPLVSRVLRDADPARVAFIASTAPLARAMRERSAGQVSVEVVPPGVHLPDANNSTSPPSDVLCAVISGSGVFDHDYEALLAGLSGLLQAHPQTQFFFDGQGSEQHQLWQAAGRYGLLSNLSMIPRRLGHRELLLGANVLIHPQAQGRSRTLLLQAMARGIPIIARVDPWIDYLIDDQTAWLVHKSDAAQWERKLKRLTEDPEAGCALGLRARAWVARQHPVSNQIAGTLRLYRSITGEPIPFAQ